MTIKFSKIKFLIIKYKFVDGLSQISHSLEFIEDKQLKFCRTWIWKLKDKKVNDHLHIFVVVAKKLESLYSFSSSLISCQNQTEIVINKVDTAVISNAKLNLPIRRMRLMKNKIDIFQ